MVEPLKNGPRHCAQFSAHMVTVNKNDETPAKHNTLIVERDDNVQQPAYIGNPFRSARSLARARFWPIQEARGLDFRKLPFKAEHMARVVLENLSKVFVGSVGEAISAVDQANLTIEDRELLVMVGPSGCGKTTTLRLIAGLEEPTSGDVAIDGQVMNLVPPKDRDIAMVFQNYALYPHMSVYENMAFGLKLRKCPKAEIERRVKAAAELLSLTACLERGPAALSGGQRQRVALGRAIVRQPKVFLFDEPLSNLDPQMRSQMRMEISRLHRRIGSTMLYVTHDPVEAMTLGERIAVMKAGVIQQVAAPMELYRHPANMFVAGFIGWPPMNLLHGTLMEKGDVLLFQEQAGNGALPGRRLDLRLVDAQASQLRSRVGQKVVLGLRPEHISEQETAPHGPKDLTVEALAEAVELTGPQVYLRLASETHSFIARTDRTDYKMANQTIRLVFDMRHAQFFDPDTEKSIV